MARDVFTTTVTGNKEIFNDLDRLAGEFPAWVHEATRAQQRVVENAIRENWLSVGGRSDDFIYDSVGFSTHYGTNGKDIVGTVGVYTIDRVMATHGRVQEEGKRKPFNASQIAYWIEFGTSRLAAGGRKKKGVEYTPDQLITVQPKPFISNAFYGTLEEQQAAFAKEWNSILGRMLK